MTLNEEKSNIGSWPFLLDSTQAIIPGVTTLVYGCCPCLVSVFGTVDGNWFEWGGKMKGELLGKEPLRSSLGAAVGTYGELDADDPHDDVCVWRKNGEYTPDVG